MKATQQFKHLMGLHLSKWIGTELAVEKGDSVVWADLTCGNLQFFDLQSVFSDGTSKQWGGGLDENGEYFRVSLVDSTSDLEMFDAHGDDILRCRDITELPTGRIQLVECNIGAHGEIVSLMLTIEGIVVTLSCGEVVWKSGKLAIEKPQEFLLVELETAK